MMSWLFHTKFSGVLCETLLKFTSSLLKTYWSNVSNHTNTWRKLHSKLVTGTNFTHKKNPKTWTARHTRIIWSLGWYIHYKEKVWCKTWLQVYWNKVWRKSSSFMEANVQLKWLCCCFCLTGLNDIKSVFNCFITNKELNMECSNVLWLCFI